MTASHPDTEQKFRKKVKSTEEKKKKSIQPQSIKQTERGLSMWQLQYI